MNTKPFQEPHSGILCFRITNNLKAYIYEYHKPSLQIYNHTTTHYNNATAQLRHKIPISPFQCKLNINKTAWGKLIAISRFHEQILEY